MKLICNTCEFPIQRENFKHSKQSCIKNLQESEVKLKDEEDKLRIKRTQGMQIFDRISSTLESEER